MKFIMKEGKREDLSLLHSISCQTYRDTFEQYNTEINMRDYLEQAYNLEKLSNELSNSNSTFYFIYVEEDLAGYLKLNEFEAQTNTDDLQALEIERIYVTKEFKGKGLGSILINKALDIAIAKAKSYIWLGVWENNENALSFYEKKGFYKTGEHSFYMGEDEQTDFNMRKDLSSCKYEL